MKPDSLLTVIGTIAAIIVALTAALVGTAMDVTSYRRQLGLCAYLLALTGMILCLSIAATTESALIAASIGLIMIIVCKAYVLLQVDSYGPELSSVQAEVGTAITGAFTWSLICNVLLIIIWSAIGTGLPNSTFGFAVTIGSIILLALSSLVTYRRLPDVPPAHKMPPGSGLISFTFQRFAKLIWETYHDYPDLGLLILSGMIFDPALTTIFAAAVSILISKYNFSADQVTIIMGLAIIAAIPAVPLSRWIASTPRLSWLFNDAAETSTVFSTAVDAKMPVGEGLELPSITTSYSAVTVHPVDKKESRNGDTALTTTQTSSADNLVLGSQVPDAARDATPADPHKTVFHAHRVRAALVAGLAITIIITILIVQVVRPCDFGLACLFCILWGFIISFCWNSHSMLRMAVVPGGRESEFAGLYLAVFSSMIWLPLFVFSIANEVWSIDGALYILTIFMGIGGIVLFFVDLERGLKTRLDTLSLRRWAHVIDAPGAGKASEA
jgi:hypothetical protein